MKGLTGSVIDQNKSTVKHATVERAGSESSGFPELTAISCVNQLIVVQKHSPRQRRLSGGNRAPDPLGKQSRERSGAEVGRPETTGMSDNG